MRKVLFFFVIIFLLVGGAFFLYNQSTPFVNTAEIEKDFTIDAAFRDFYYSVSDPLLVFGYPISNVTATDGHKRQYFQRAVLELNANSNTVTMLNLGWEYRETGALVKFTRNDAGCRIFSNGYSVCYDFLEFYEKNGGEAIFGLPIANMQLSNDHVVQYFERACMEWNQNSPTDEPVSLRDLGTLYMQREASRGMYAGAPALNNTLNVNAFVAEAVIAENGQQTLYVVVMNDKYELVSGAKADAVLVYPDGSRMDLPLGICEGGTCKITFPVQSAQPRQVVNIQVRVQYGSDTYNTATWFRVWW